jgi:preprotein translocase subunit SecD
VVIRLDESGERRFTETTRDGVGRLLALVVDGEVIIAPYINTPIEGGTVQVSGGLTPADAAELAARIDTAARGCTPSSP